MGRTAYGVRGIQLREVVRRADVRPETIESLAGDPAFGNPPLEVGQQFELRAARNDPHGELAAQSLLAHPVPALVELALPARDPFLRHMVRCVSRAGSEIGEERFIGSESLLKAGPFDRLVGQIGHQVIARRGGNFDPVQPFVEGG